MSTPNKKRGFRKITINDIDFNWGFVGKIDIRPADNRNNQLIVDFGWYDVWLFVNDPDNVPPPYEPKVITPLFVQECVLFAFENGWNIEKKAGKFEIFYRNGVFSRTHQ